MDIESQLSPSNPTRPIAWITSDLKVLRLSTGHCLGHLEHAWSLKDDRVSLKITVLAFWVGK